MIRRLSLVETPLRIDYVISEDAARMSSFSSAHLSSRQATRVSPDQNLKGPPHGPGSVDPLISNRVPISKTRGVRSAEDGETHGGTVGDEV